LDFAVVAFGFNGWGFYVVVFASYTTSSFGAGQNSSSVGLYLVGEQTSTV